MIQGPSFFGVPPMSVTVNQTIQQAEAHFLKFCIQYASIALIYYDYVLTFRAEVTHIWRPPKFRIFTLLYILTRYALVANILYLLAISSKLSKYV
ncbi:hypothetical protein C0995_005286 [Termitomyces sp. Mi166|nr:hypothetical protein C0995_005286 [Termitomyces sp. Mi166\